MVLTKRSRVIFLGGSIALIAIVAIFIYQYWYPRPWTFTKTIRQVEIATVYEGLPHQNFEQKALAEELRTKLVQDLDGYPFYQEALVLSEDDRASLQAILSDVSNYAVASDAVMKCGGFHPDYAVEWTVDGAPYRVLICFGCREFKVIGSDSIARYRFSTFVSVKLRALLIPYRKNRPRQTPDVLEGKGFSVSK